MRILPYPRPVDIGALSDARFTDASKTAMVGAIQKISDSKHSTKIFDSKDMKATGQHVHCGGILNEIYTREA